MFMCVTSLAGGGGSLIDFTPWSIVNMRWAKTVSYEMATTPKAPK